MKCSPAPIADADLQTAIDPEIGAEKQLFVSYNPWNYLGDIAQTLAGVGDVDGAGTYTPNPIAVAAAPDSGFDLQLISTNGALSVEEIVATFGVTFADATVGTATATFAIPARAVNQAFSIPAGTAVDLIGVGAGAAKQIATITGLTSITGGYVGNQFKLVALPDATSYSLVGFVTEAGLKLPVSGSVPIADGFDGSAAIKRGRSEPGTLTAKSHYIDYMSGLARINGFFVTARIDVLKDDRVLTERTIIGRWKAMCNPTRGDGNDPVMGDAEGAFQEFAVFVAP